MESCPNQHSSRGKIGILACEGGKPFADKLFSSLQILLEKEGCVNGGAVQVGAREVHFPDTEVNIEIDNVRGLDLFIVQDTENKQVVFEDYVPLGNITLPDFMLQLPDYNPDMLVAVKRPLSVDEHLRALTGALDAAEDAHYRTVVLPVFAYSRQDKKRENVREPLNARNILTSLKEHGATGILTLDVHNRAIFGGERVPCENLYASKLLMDYFIEKIGLDDLVIGTPDVGGAGRARFYAQRLGLPFALGDKLKDYSKPGSEPKYIVIGDVVGKKVLMVDDMIATASSLKSCVVSMRENGAREVWFACSLPLFTYPATDRIDDLFARELLNGVISTNAVFHPTKEFCEKHPWYHEVPVENLFAEAVFRINHYGSIKGDLLKTT